MWKAEAKSVDSKTHKKTGYICNMVKIEGERRNGKNLYYRRNIDSSGKRNTDKNLLKDPWETEKQDNVKNIIPSKIMTVLHGEPVKMYLVGKFGEDGK